MRLLLVLLTSLLFTTPLEPRQSEAVELLTELSNLQLDKEQIYSIRNITVRRDALSVSFNRGAIAFLEPVGGQVTGAIFVGSGEILSIPPDPIEKLQVYKFTGSPILNERFDAGFFRFTDDTYAELLDQLQDGNQEEVRVEDLEALLPWEENLGQVSRLLNVRLLMDLVGKDRKPLFHAELRNEKLGWFNAVYDQRAHEEVAVASARRDGNSATADIWMSFNRRSQSRDPEFFAHENLSSIDVISYAIDLTIKSDIFIEGLAEIGFRMRSSEPRVLSFGLARSLRLSEVTLDGKDLLFFQHDESDIEQSYQGFDSFGLVLPEGVKKDDELTVKFRYSGDVLEGRGKGIYFVSQRSLWYPNRGPQDPASFELNFHYPATGELVATGRLVDQVEEGGSKHSRWESGREFFVAGFKYGDFSIESYEDGSVPVFLCLNNNVETIYKDVELQRAIEKEMALQEVGRMSQRNSVSNPSVRVNPDYDNFSTKDLGPSILHDIRLTVEFFSEKFGDYPFEQLAVSQSPVPFSQGWPSLLYVSTLSFFSPEQRERLGLQREVDLLEAELDRAHEIAHQWFGNKVGWRSYRDQWITEGFANYAGAMYLAAKYENRDSMRSILDKASLRLFSKTGKETTHDDNGPLWIGHRLSTSRVPNGYAETVYNKATWVVHMLRSLMSDPLNPSDDRFLGMTREFLDKFDGEPASTWDLKSVAENHMSDRMDVTGDGDLDWFFDQWVFGTGAPSYELRYEVRPSSKGFRVSGEILQKAEKLFLMPVPLYIKNGKEITFLGDVIVSNNVAPFAFNTTIEPESVEIDPFKTILQLEQQD